MAAFVDREYNAQTNWGDNLIWSLTMYRPNFCAECGAKIIRLNWRPWTSRRFCDGCAPAFIRQHAICFAVAGLVVFGFGMAIGRTARTATPPVVIQRNSPAPDTATTTKPTNSTSTSASTAPPAVEETVYMCGARTRKGTPCTRRVRGPVRCWQHRGKPAMLPQEKLQLAS